MKKFIDNLKKYYKYAVYSAKSELKAEVANSYLNWLWWILDPVCFMLIYTFIVQIVFKTSEDYFPVFVFIGLTAWNYFNKMITSSVKIVKSNKAIVTKVYIPKYILLFQKSFVNLFKMLVSLSLVFVLMLFFRVPFSWTLLFIPVILFILYLVTFGLGAILLHFGIFVEDLSNVVNILLKLVFYLSGIFYSIGTRLSRYGILQTLLLKVNPIAFIMDQLRNVILYNQLPDFLFLGVWFIIGIILTSIGIAIIHRYENSYAKVI